MTPPVAGIDLHRDTLTLVIVDSNGVELSHGRATRTGRTARPATARGRRAPWMMVTAPTADCDPDSRACIDCDHEDA